MLVSSYLHMAILTGTARSASPMPPKTLDKTRSEPGHEVVSKVGREVAREVGREVPAEAHSEVGAKMVGKVIGEPPSNLIAKRSMKWAAKSLTKSAAKALSNPGVKSVPKSGVMREAKWFTNPGRPHTKAAKDMKVQAMHRARESVDRTRCELRAFDVKNPDPIGLTRRPLRSQRTRHATFNDPSRTCRFSRSPERRHGLVGARSPAGRRTDLLSVFRTPRSVGCLAFDVERWAFRLAQKRNPTLSRAWLHGTIRSSRPSVSFPTHANRPQDHPQTVRRPACPQHR